jgi:DNA-directed RNA polymerase specialized sigma24 family protein
MTRSQGALAELFDTYGDQLFGYCLRMLGNREIALIALRDTLIAAQAHITRLADSGSAISLLYSLARAECRRRGPVRRGAAGPAEAAGSGPRLTAWNTVMALEAGEREALDLSCRAGVELGLVLGMPAERAQALADRARRSLERALGAEIVISRGLPACPDRALVMAGWAGTVTPVIRERTLRHAASCPVCGPALPRNVSPARVFALLPSPALSAREREELLRFASPAGGPRVPRGPRGPRALLAGAAAVALASTCVLLGATDAAIPAPGAAGEAPAVPAAQSGFPASGRPDAAGRGRAGVGRAGAPRYRAQLRTLRPFPGPGGARGEAVIAVVTQPLPAGVQRVVPGRLTVTPGSLALGAGLAGQLEVTAVGGPVRWSAATSTGRVSLSSYSGTLRAGQSITLVVSVSRVDGSAGIAVITISAGSSARAIGVSWAARPAHEAGYPSPSPSPSGPAPSPSPTPSPSAS